MTGPGTNQHLTHDANGNIDSYYHDGAWHYFDVATTGNHLLGTTGADPATYQYDANGNITAGNGASCGAPGMVPGAPALVFNAPG